MITLSSTSTEVRREGRIFLRYICLRRVKGRTVAEFKSSKNAKPIAKVGIRPEFFNKFAEVFRLEPVEANEKEVTYVTERDEVFDLTLLYACVLRVLRNKNNVCKVIDVMLSLHPFELTFWNYRLINAKDKYERDRIARAFLMIYGLGAR